MFALSLYLYGDRMTTQEESLTALKDLVFNAEKESVRYALKTTDNNMAKAARILGIHRTLLYKKMKKYGIRTGADRSLP